MFPLPRQLEKNEPYIAVQNQFTEDELESIRAMIENAESYPAQVGYDGSERTDVEHRSSHIRRLEARDPQFQWLYTKLGEIVFETNMRAFGLDIGFIENIQLTEYDESYKGHFSPHIDMSYGFGGISNRKLSLTLQLSKPDSYEGGDLKLYANSVKWPEKAPREYGVLTLFRSHIIHEVTPVTKGKRLSLVTWIHGPLVR